MSTVTYLHSDGAEQVVEVPAGTKPDEGSGRPRSSEQMLAASGAVA